MRHTETPLTGLEADAFDRIQSLANTHDSELTRTAVIDALGEFDAVESAALLHRLLQKGYLYEVDGEIRIT